MKKSVFVDAVSIALMILFLYASVSKLADYEKFRVQLGQSPLLTAIAGPIALFIPVSEIIIAILLLLSKYRVTGLYLSFGMMVLFTAYIIAITRFSDIIPCSCGGILEHLGWSAHLVFNSCFLLLAAIAILASTVQNGPAT